MITLRGKVKVFSNYTLEEKMRKQSTYRRGGKGRRIPMGVYKSSFNNKKKEKMQRKERKRKGVKKGKKKKSPSAKAHCESLKQLNCLYAMIGKREAKIRVSWGFIHG